MVLTTIVCAMMFSVLNEQEKSSTRLTAHSGMQDELRFAMQTITRQIRMTGFGVGFQVQGSVKWNGVSTLRTCNGCGQYDVDGNGSSTGERGSDQLFLIYRNPSQQFVLDWNYYELNEVLCEIDALRVGKLQSLLSTGTEEDDLAELSEGDTIACFDETVRQGGLGLAWTIRGEGGRPTPTADLNVVPNVEAPFTTVCPGSLPPRLSCGSLQGSIVGFYLYGDVLYMDDNGDSYANPTQTLANAPLTNIGPSNTDDIPIARGIEDFQLAFCIPAFDDPAAATADQVRADIQSCMEDPSSGTWHGPEDLDDAKARYVRAVRVTIVARGPQDNMGRAVVSRRPRAEDNVPSNPESVQRYPRLVQSTVVQLPNYRYLDGFAREDLTQ